MTFKKGYCAVLWFEELDQFDGMEHIRSIRQSLVRGGDKHYVFYSYNPPRSLGNWVNEEANKQATNPNYYIHTSNYLGVPEEWLGQAFFDEAEDLKERNENAYKHEYLGEMVGSGNQVFANIELRTITDEEIAEFDNIHQGVDWGYYPDPFAYLKVHYHKSSRTLYLMDEYTGCKLSNQQSAEEVLKRKANGWIWCDSAEPKSIADFRSMGIDARPVKKGPDSIRYGIKWLQSQVKIVIDRERTPHAAKEFSRYEYEVDGQGNPMEGYPDKDNHLLDCCRYSCSMIMRVAGD
jgi:PBSX family phage terminase large subunit